MATCFFDSDYDQKHNCEYELLDGEIIVTVTYDIMDEIVPVNGIKMIGSDTQYRKRDILIIDYAAQKNYLVKQAYYAGSNQVFGTADSRTTTTFRSSMFFEHGDPKRLKQLLPVPKVKTIRVFSKSILNWISKSSLSIKSSDERVTCSFLRNPPMLSVPINKHNIKELSIFDSWSLSRRDGAIHIDMIGCIELELMKRENYTSIHTYLYELMTYVQLYCPNKLLIEKVEVTIDDVSYRLHCSLKKEAFTEKVVEPTVKEELGNFLSRCYEKIHFRKSSSDIRNIPYIVSITHRGLEDNFLMFYRFIECYYKKRRTGEQRGFICGGIEDHYHINPPLTAEQVEALTHEIISLRNQYVHSGYYLNNHSLRIKFDPIDKKANPKNFTVNNVDIDWIYTRTKILYRIAIDIIYRNMLGYDVYSFSKHF